MPVWNSLWSIGRGPCRACGSTTKEYGQCKPQMTYPRSGGLSGHSGGVHYDIDLRICMRREDKIDRLPVPESVS